MSTPSTESNLCEPPYPVSLSDESNNLTKWLHSKSTYNPQYLSEPEPTKAIQNTAQILNTHLKNLSIKQEIPPQLTAALESDTFFFSGFKTHHYLNEASKLLKDANGNLKPFNQFLNDIQKLDKTYNKNYLRAEYNFAAASVQMAVKWKEWERDGDEYNLQYRTAGDDRVREEHAAINNTTLPPSDPFWKSFLPPNGWNCRCTVSQVRKSSHPLSNSEEAIAKGNAMTDHPKKQIFRFNPGAQQKVFPPKHPYYKAEPPTDCSNCTKKLAYNKNSIKCTLCSINNTIKKTMDPKVASKMIKNDLIGKTIPTQVTQHNKNGIVKLNSHDLKDFLCKKHSRSSESKWVLHEIQRGNANLGQPQFETLDMTRPNIQEKIKRGWQGINVYNLTAFNKKWELKTAIIHNNYEVPYCIKEKP